MRPFNSPSGILASIESGADSSAVLCAHAERATTPRMRAVFLTFNVGSRLIGKRIREEGSRAAPEELMGPAGLEPATKGFAVSPRFREERTISSPAIARAIVRVRDAHCLSSRALRALR